MITRSDREVGIEEEAEVARGIERGEVPDHRGKAELVWKEKFRRNPKKLESRYVFVPALGGDLCKNPESGSEIPDSGSEKSFMKRRFAASFSISRCAAFHK